MRSLIGLKYVRGWLALVALVFSSSSVMGQGEKTISPSAVSPLMSALDRNGNGKIEAQEIDLAVASLRALDRNKDGEISSGELAGASPGSRKPGGAPTQAGARPSRPPIFSNLDKNKDGKISKEETPKHMLASFKRMDRNDDGFIDKEEQEGMLRLIQSRVGPGNRKAPQEHSGEKAGRSDETGRSKSGVKD